MNRSLINCSFNKIPVSPRTPNGPLPHAIFNEDKIVANILKFVPSMKSCMLVNKTFKNAASKLRENRDWLVIKDSQSLLDSKISLDISEQRFSKVHVGKRENRDDVEDDENDFRRNFDHELENVDGELCNTFFHDIRTYIEIQKDGLKTLELESIRISMENLIAIVKAPKKLTELILSHVDLIGYEKNSAVIKAISKFQSELKTLSVNECSDSMQSFIQILPCTTLESLFIRAKNMDHLRRIIQKNRGLKRLNLQLPERQDSLPRDLLNEIELTHLTILLNNKDNLDPIFENQIHLKSLITNARIGRNVIKRMDENFTEIEELGFKGDRIDHDVLSIIAGWKNLKTVKIDFNYASSMLIVDVLSIFFKKSFKYSPHAVDSGVKNFYKLSKPSKPISKTTNVVKSSLCFSSIDLNQSIKREIACESPVV